MATHALHREPVKPVVVTIGDPAKLRRLLRARLIGQGYRFLEAPTGASGVQKVSTRPPDLVLLDLRIPDMSAVEVIRRLRQWTPVPIIVLSDHGDDRVNVAALDAGADDCVSIPFSPDELLARMRVALRRSVSPRGGDGFTVGELEVDIARRRVTVGGTAIHLTPIEYKILTTLVRHAGAVIPHAELLSEVWGPARRAHSHYLRVYMAHLRQKLERGSTRRRYLLTEPRVGYRLVSERGGYSAPSEAIRPPADSRRRAR